MPDPAVTQPGAGLRAVHADHIQHTALVTQVVKPGQVGRTVDVWSTIALLEGYLIGMQDGEITLIVLDAPPLIFDVSEQAEIARNILSKPLIHSMRLLVCPAESKIFIR